MANWIGMSLEGYRMAPLRRDLSACVDDWVRRGMLENGVFIEGVEGQGNQPGHYLSYIATEGAVPVSEQAKRLCLEKRLTVPSEDIRGAFTAMTAFGHPERYIVPRVEDGVAVFDLYLANKY